MAHIEQLKWSDSEVEVLKINWLQGLSFGMIAALLNRDRSAISGKLNRLGLLKSDDRKTACVRLKIKPQNSHDSIPFDQERWSKAMVRKSDSECGVAYHGKPLDGSNPVALEDAKPDHCRWIVAHEGSDKFCGATKERGSFCKHHGALAYDPKNQIP